MKKPKLEYLGYKSNWDTATPEEKEELQRRLDQAYSFLFEKVIERRKQENDKSKSVTI